MQLFNDRLKVVCSSKFNSIGNIITVDDPRNKRNSVAEKLSDSSLFLNVRPKRNAASNESTPTPSNEAAVTCSNLTIPLTPLETANTFSTNVRVNSLTYCVGIFLKSLFYSSQFTSDMKMRKACTTCTFIAA